MAEGARAALVLGSGGARGYAHIGVIEVLRERGFEVVAIAGTSMGALVGGVTAAGRLEAYTEWARSLSQREVWRLLDLSITAPGGAIRAERIIQKVGEILDGATIESLPIPFTAVATDINARREVWFQRGPVEKAIRASIAIPGVITPAVINGRVLVDGGLINPVPIEPTAAAAADLTIAVSLSGMRAAGATATPVKASSEQRPREEWTSRLRRSAAEVLDSERVRAITGRFTHAREEPDHLDPAAFAPDGVHLTDAPEGRAPAAEGPAARPGISVAAAASADLAVDTTQTPTDALLRVNADIGLVDLLNMSFETMSALISRYRMASNPPDVLITVPSNAVRTLDFHRAAEMIDLGRRLASEALDQAGY
ncbi:patatin-like phospholipase family protein [Humibacillus xanthopallidus]|uniref:NTE family protein n=1 Tax=Humibacillus xanthopallidus TaxID=412689 RepID=A0A543HFT5_9MICO|nr:patatin-like phospholipase family protein [Humibacillus xanthopallidus]TQM57180.1 NTE family protein [Humibacillus xanthopallidus]